jgi:hypothetical protein
MRAILSKTSVPAPSAPEPEFTVNSLDELKDSLRRVDGLVQQSDGSSMLAVIRKRSFSVIGRQGLCGLA